MNTKSRIASILKSSNLDISIAGIETFDLSELDLATDLDFEIPTNVRLGHLAEKVVSESIKLSSNYSVLYENVQLIEDKKTIGEIDFILEKTATKQLIHMELAYKFYLFDPSISSDPIKNWIGPNRNDSLNEKLDKLKEKQFPLLYHDCAKSALSKIEIDKTTQALCLLASLFVPYQYKASFSSVFEKAIKGYYLNFKMFISLNQTEKLYFIPSKKEWGIDPSENEIWTDLNGVEKYIQSCVNDRQSPLCWQKYDNLFSAFFIVWW